MGGLIAGTRARTSKKSGGCSGIIRRLTGPGTRTRTLRR
ncbi:hypothetical protein VB1_CDS0023 [Arthrobacter phage Marchesin]|nr:hypothetical protein VB1_CDS0023 [Arthrobacter phage Marchesin]